MKKIIITVALIMAMSMMLAVPMAADAVYDVAADGDLLYTVNFNKLEGDMEFTEDIANGSKTISEDGKVLTVEHPEATGSGLAGVNLPQYQYKGHVYTMEFWAEVSTPATTRIGFRFLRGGDEATYGFFTQKDEFMASVKCLRNGTAGANLPTNEFRYSEGENYRQFFKIVVDGINGEMRLYAKSLMDAAHDYVFLGAYSNVPMSDETPGSLNAMLWLWDVGKISVGDINIYKGDQFAKAAEDTTTTEKPADDTTPSETTTEEPVVTTTPSETTTEKPADDTTPSETTTDKPAENNTTTAAPTTDKPEEKGCGGFGTAAVAAVLISICGAGIVFFGKKH